MNIIGLDKNKTQALIKELNILLANYQVFYMNVRGFHWNIKGENFFELHAKFEELYDDLLVKIDEVAERILTLGDEPVHTFSDYLENAEIEEAKSVSEDKKSVKLLLEGFQKLLKIQRNILQLSDEAEDEGTNALMSDYIREQEKLVWMYAAYLK
ncbi:MAG: DNA starvation/stationary phase protection protein [Bacteroidales bacterium]|nr:DNA starvation/stationary phase protection protein [Bacteroidales bacterium]MCF8388129.1 DNA starvation/stationary phase protection protein [Bacteroidales bacterium]MCF8398891.1 DNA starvation/stationary phase protection protein [Bacteroidales bacterium]